MADNPIKANLPKDLPENWNETNYVSPNGTEVGLTKKYGYNYLMEQVNNAQEAAIEAGAAFAGLVSLDKTTGKIVPTQIPALDYQAPTQSLPIEDGIVSTDVFPIYSRTRSQNEKLTLRRLKELITTQLTELYVITDPGNTLKCTKGTFTFTGTGTTAFQLPEDGDWTVTATFGQTSRSRTVTIVGLGEYTLDMRLIREVAVTKNPDKMQYEIDEQFAPAGAQITATAYDGTTYDVTSLGTWTVLPLFPPDTTIVFSLIIAGHTATTSVTVTVNYKNIPALPTLEGTYTYTGAMQTAQWENYDALKMTLGGIQVSTNAGTYIATFTPTEYYQWWDGTRTAKPVQWIIQPKQATLSISPTTMILSPSTSSLYISVSYDGDGAILASSQKPAIADVTITTQKLIRVQAGDTIGFTQVAVTANPTTNYIPPPAAICGVTVEGLSPILDENGWDAISTASKTGEAANLWAVGDQKALTVYGTVAGTTINAWLLQAFIIGFNHNAGIEGTNLIHFQIAKNLFPTTPIALTPSNYNSSTSEGFIMNGSTTNVGGWGDCKMRITLLRGDENPHLAPNGTFPYTLGRDLVSYMRSVVKYTDNVGGGSSDVGNISETTEYLFLPSEFEMFGIVRFGNPNEATYQKQYAYYASGNSTIKYSHADTSRAVMYWLRSPRIGSAGLFVNVGETGDPTSYSANRSFAVAPCFCV